MPNHINNKITFVGSPEKIKKFISIARGPKPITKENEGSCNYSDPSLPPEISDFEFNQLVPLPKEFFEKSYNDAGFGQDMERDCWGIKWGAYSIEKPVIENNSVTYSFQTAWGAPIVFLEKVALKYPDLQIFLSYGGEGPIRGRYYFKGNVISDNSDAFPDYKNDPNYPKCNEDDPDFDEDKWFNEYSNWQESALISHDSWWKSYVFEQISKV